MKDLKNFLNEAKSADDFVFVVLEDDLDDAISGVFDSEVEAKEYIASRKEILPKVKLSIKKEKRSDFVSEK